MKKTLTILITGCFLIGLASYIAASSGQAKTELKTVIKRPSFLRASTAQGILHTYLSPRGTIRAVRETNTLIIEDVPEVVAKILNILEEIDIKPSDLHFTVDLIQGSKDPEKRGYVDEDLKSDPLIKELRSILKFDSFQSLGSILIKIQDNSYSSHSLGRNLQLRMEPRVFPDKKGNVSIQVELRLDQREGFNKEGRAVSSTLFNTTLSIKSGERTVVGVSKLDGGDKALILIVSGKVIK